MDETNRQTREAFHIDRQKKSEVEPEFGVDNVPFFDRLMAASVNDPTIGYTEGGQPVRKTFNNQTYSYALNPDQRTTRTKIEEDVIPAVAQWIDDPNIPSMSAIWDAAKSMGKESADSLEDAVTSKGTMGDVFGLAGLGALGSTASKVPEGALRTFGGKAYKEKDEFRQTPFNKYSFSNPVQEHLKSVEVPSKGLKGSVLIKSMEASPEIRGSLLSAMDLKIDPQKRYTKEDLDNLSNEADYEATINLDTDNINEFQQRQSSVGLQYGYKGENGVFLPEKDILGEQVDYVEMTIDAQPGGGSKASVHKPSSGRTHYNPETIAHTRFSVVETPTNENIILVEELQSDLLQHGYKKPEPKVHLPIRDWELFQEKGVTPKTFSKNYDKFKELQDEIDANPEATSKEQFLKALKNRNTFIDTFIKDHGLSESHFGKVLNAFEIIEPAPGSPPIKKTKESVDATLKGIFAYAQEKGINKVVIPPFEKIVEARFPKGTIDYENALKPNSGFSQTYRSALSKSLNELENNYGGKVSISQIDLPYEKLRADRIAYNYLNQSGDTAAEILFDRGIRNNSLIDPEQTSLDQAIENIKNNSDRSEIEMNVIIENLKEAREAVQKQIDTQETVSQGTVIDLSGMSDLDLTKPRFAKGGSVMQEGGFRDDGMEQEARTGNEVPPGSLDQEVSDSVDAKLSEGEYVLPADVVRFIGLGKIESMVEKAQKSLGEMEAKGRIGGETVDENGVPSDELTPEEMAMLEEAMAADQGQTPEAMGMAEGGMVPDVPAPPIPEAPVPGNMSTDDQTDELMFKSDRGSRSSGPNVGTPDTATAPSVSDMVGMSPEAFSDQVSQHNEHAQTMGAFGFGPVGIAMSAVDKITKARQKEAMAQNPDLATPEAVAAVGQKNTFGMKGLADTIGGVVGEAKDALGLGDTDEADADTAGAEGASDGGEAEGGEADGGAGEGGADGGDAGGEGGDSDGGGSGDGGGDGGGGYTKGGLVKKRPANKRKKPVKKKRRYSLGTRP